MGRPRLGQVQRRTGYTHSTINLVMSLASDGWQTDHMSDPLKSAPLYETSRQDMNFNKQWKSRVPGFVPPNVVCFGVSVKEDLQRRTVVAVCRGTLSVLFISATGVTCHVPREGFFTCQNSGAYLRFLYFHFALAACVLVHKNGVCRQLVAPVFLPCSVWYSLPSQHVRNDFPYCWLTFLLH